MTDFAIWAAAGFTSDLVPIIPPDAPLSASSTIRPEDRGKAPGRKNGEGTWAGFDWRSREASEQDLAAWAQMGAGAGLRASRYPGLDIDVLDEQLAGLIEAEARRALGQAPVRIGRAPKRLLAYRTAEPFGRIALRFRAPDDERGHLVELLGAGRQYVIDGVHPLTRKPYTWSERPKASLLTEIDQAKAEAFFADLEMLLDLLGCMVLPRESSTTTDRSKIDQDALRGNPDRLDEAIALLPNDNAWFPDRSDYINVGIAIKSAYGPDEEPRGLERWLEWTSRWEGNSRSPAGNDPDAARADWESFKPPFAIGADYIFRLAGAFGFNVGAEAFEAFGPAPDPEPSQEQALPAISPINFVIRPDTPPPPREFLVEEWLPARILTSLYGPPGVGKSLLAQQIATCLAVGREIFGFKIRQTPVLALFSEDDNDELERRQWRINCELGLRNEDLGKLHIEGRSGQINAIVTFPSGAPKVELLSKAIIAKARELGAGLIILDNRAQMILGNENDRMVATYGGNLCGRIGHKAGAAVLLVGHPAKLTGSEYSGSTAWDAVTRSRWLLRRVEIEDGAEPASAELVWTLAKSNYSPPGKSVTLTWVNGVLRLAESAQSPEQLAEAEFRQEAAREAFLEGLDQLTAQGRAVSHSSATRNYAPKVMAELLEGFTKGELEQAMECLFKDGLILAGMPVGWSKCRHRTYGIARSGSGGS
jgi:RecA-family ATPase